MNVGPTFHNPEGSADDATSLPQRIDWISKNPDVGKGQNDYEKTIVWSIPPNAFVGHIVLGGGGYTYEGEFVPPGSRKAKKAEDLDEDEKDRFKKIFENERKAADDFHDELKKAKKKPLHVAPRAAGVLGTANILSSALPLRPAIHLSQVPRVGTIVTVTVTATTSLNGFSLGRTPIAHTEWALGKRVLPRKSLRLRLLAPGRFRIKVSVRDRYGAYGTASRVAVVHRRS